MNQGEGGDRLSQAGAASGGVLAFNENLHSSFLQSILHLASDFEGSPELGLALFLQLSKPRGHDGCSTQGSQAHHGNLANAMLQPVPSGQVIQYKESHTPEPSAENVCTQAPSVTSRISEGALGTYSKTPLAISTPLMGFKGPPVGTALS